MRALVIVGTGARLAAVVRAVRSHGLHSIIALNPQHATRLVGRYTLDIAIIAGPAARAAPLLSALERRRVPFALVGDPGELASRSDGGTVAVAVPDPDDLPDALDILLGDGAPTNFPPVVDVGVLRLDRDARLAIVEDREVALPPKEFAILTELARYPGCPVSSTELVERVWRGAASTTVEDVHRHVYRLRRMIGDHRRIPPLIMSRRGFGYVLK